MMKALQLRKCVLLALTLLIPASQGRAYPWRKAPQDLQYQYHYGKGHSRGDGRVYGRLPSSTSSSSINTHHRAHLARNTALQELLQETFAEFLDEPSRASDNRLPPPILSNDLEEIEIGPEEEALYSARVPDRDERPREWSRQRHLSDRYQNYHQEVCTTKKGWKELQESVDVDGNEVVIVNSIAGQNQTYYSYECVSPCTACKGVIGSSMCKMRYTYVKMLYHLKDESSTETKWDFVEVPSHCACELITEYAIDECLD